MMRRLLLPLVAMMVAGAAWCWVPREHVNLNGTWQRVTTSASATQPPTSGWEEVKVPGVIGAHDYKACWWRRTFDAPVQWQGRRVKIRLQGAKYCPELYVNGRKVGAHFGGYEPCEFDATGVIKPGQPNEIMVHVTDWTALFKGPRVEFPKNISWNALRSFPRDRVMYPIGGRFTEVGLWDDVVAYAVPDVYVSDLFITTDVARHELAVTYEITNATRAPASVALAASVMDGSRTVLRLPTRTLRVPATAEGKPARVRITTGWPQKAVKLWTPETPRLYMLVTKLKSSAGEDRRRDRFGFRQFTVKGPDFYLNGVKRHLLATASWPRPEKTHDEIADVLRRLKSANCVAFRTHTQPWRQIWYDVADEVGLMMIAEGAVWNDDTTYRLDDPGFWKNWAMHLTGAVRVLRNHPSVVMWSLENEFFGRRARAGSVYEKRLANLGRLVKRLDPTRPITYESDGDPGGVADVIGMHYPHEAPTYRLWPLDAYWMDKPQPIGSTRMFWPTAEFKWDKKKPLYIGEFLWYPCGTPAGYTLVLGDEAYADLSAARKQAKAATWKWQTVAYRHYGVSGISPWTLVEGGPLDMQLNPMMAAQAYSMQPLAAYLREETRRAYAGSQVERHLEVFNDTPRPFSGTLRWTLVAGGRTLAEGGAGLKLAPADHRDLLARFTAPAVSGSLKCTFRVTMETDGRRCFADEHPFTVYGPIKLPALTHPLYVYDPTGTTIKALRKQGLRVVQIPDLRSLPDPAAGAIVIGEGVLAAGAFADPWQAFEAGRGLNVFVRRGGRVIVLQQTDWPSSLMPFHLDAGARSTMAFLQMPHHPVLKGLPKDAFKFWQPDHIVTSGEIVRTDAVGLRPLVATGHPDGVSHCALAEAPRGKGLYLLCQMPVLARLDQEPMAAEILARLLKRADEYDAQASSVVLLGGDKAYEEALDEMGLAYLRAKAGPQALQEARVLLARGDVGIAPDKLADWVKSGGHVLLDRPTAAVVGHLGAEAALKLGVDDFAGPVLRTSAEDPMVEAVTREDLYWLGKKPLGPFWLSQPLALNTCVGALSMGLNSKPLETLGPADMQLDGYIVKRQEDAIIMATVGSATGTLSVPEEGNYLIVVEARGTKCEGQYAFASVSVDGKVVGVVGTSPDWRRRTVLTRMEAGAHQVTVAFVNDRSTAKEDRNFFLRSVAVAQAPAEALRLVRIASGPAVAALSLGKGLVVFNFLRWDVEKRNKSKARRFFSSLLLALGADFRDQFGVRYNLADFQPMEGLAHHHVHGDRVSMGTSGWIAGEISVPATGDYLLRLEARGTEAAGEFPEVVLSLDGQDLGAFHLTGEDWRWYTVRSRLQAGKHTLRITFTNDYYRPPEDRNLELGGLMLTPAE